MITWNPIKDFTPNSTPEQDGKRWLICKDCGENTKQSVSVCWYNSATGLWFFDSANDWYSLCSQGYRITHFAEIENLP